MTTYNVSRIKQEAAVSESAGNPPADLPKYHKVRVTIHHVPHGRDFGFGTAVINGVPTEVFVGAWGHSMYYGENWHQVEPKTPTVGDVIYAKVCTEVPRGKKPDASLWNLLSGSTNDDQDKSGERRGPDRWGW